MSPLRAICIWGSESSTAKHGITKHAKDWKGRSGVNFTVDVMSGNEAAGLGFAVLKERYDVMLIATSSYGDGEAPGGYERFFKVLMDSANSESKPLEGMQHAVLGYGGTLQRALSLPALSHPIARYELRTIHSPSQRLGPMPYRHVLLGDIPECAEALGQVPRRVRISPLRAAR